MKFLDIKIIYHAEKNRLIFINQHTAGFKFTKSQISTRANEFLQSKHDVNFRCIH